MFIHTCPSLAKPANQDAWSTRPGRYKARLCLFTRAPLLPNRQKQDAWSTRPGRYKARLCLCTTVLPYNHAYIHICDRKNEEEAQKTAHHTCVQTTTSEAASRHTPQAGERLAQDAAHTRQKDGSGASPWRETREATPAQQQSSTARGAH